MGCIPSHEADSDHKTNAHGSSAADVATSSGAVTTTTTTNQLPVAAAAELVPHTTQNNAAPTEPSALPTDNAGTATSIELHDAAGTKVSQMSTAPSTITSTNIPQAVDGTTTTAATRSSVIAKSDPPARKTFIESLVTIPLEEISEMPHVTTRPAAADDDTGNASTGTGHSRDPVATVTVDAGAATERRPTVRLPTTGKMLNGFGLVNKLSPTLAHSSLAARNSQTASAIAAALAAVANDDDDDDGGAKKNPIINGAANVANKKNNATTNSGSRSTDSNSDGLLQKITVGGEEAIHHLRNIFAAPISFATNTMLYNRGGGGTSSQPSSSIPNADKNMPYYPKSPNEQLFLQNVLRQHYLFDSQPEPSLQKLINAFEMCTIDMYDPDAIAVTDETTNTTQYHVNIIQQGEQVRTYPTDEHPITNAYFYIVYYGTCQFVVDDTVVGFATSGDAFGELALLYNGPRAATVTAILQESIDVTNSKNSISSTKSDVAATLSEMDDQRMTISEPDVTDTPNVNESTVVVPTFPDYTMVLFRVHQRSFRVILQQEDQNANDTTMKLLNNIEFLNVVAQSVKDNLARVMVPFPFNKGDHIVQKGMMDCPWIVIERGTIRGTNFDHGYQDFLLYEGQCVGERAIMAQAPAIGDAFAETAGVGFIVDNDTFRTVIGNSLSDNINVISRQQDAAKLKAMSILSSATQTNHRVLNYLSKQITDHTYPVGEVICHAGQPLIHPPSLYLVRNGRVRLDCMDETGNKELKFIVMDAFFGEDQLRADMAKGKYISPYTATVIEECTCGVLKLRDCRNVINTRRMGEAHNVLIFDSLSVGATSIAMKDLSIHRMIGAGTFGQVFLVSRKASTGSESVYALKVQSKYELCQSGQSKGVVREKNLMMLFHSPFVAQLLAAFQDDKCVYMVMNLLQGGELYSVMHTKKSNVLPEQNAKFYVACVAEALFYLHCSHSLVFRDLKPENVMIDDKGYAVLIDFGFCKKITGKTYTTCGTPLYLAPEVILNRGHSWSVDYWSLGIMLYEMLVGHTPFYENGMNKAELFQNIVRGKVYPPTDVSPEVLSLLSGLLRRDPAKRLGSLVGNENEVIDHPWFNDIDRDLLFLKDLEAPFIPQIKDPLDSSNFSSWKHVDDKRFIHYPALTTEEQAIFEKI